VLARPSGHYGCEPMSDNGLQSTPSMWPIGRHVDFRCILGLCM